MDIRFVSSLSPDDELRIAGGLLRAMAALLDQLPIAYCLKIDTVVGEEFHHTHYPNGEVKGPRLPFPLADLTLPESSLAR